MNKIKLVITKNIERNQVKNLLISPVELKIINYDSKIINSDDMIMITLLSRSKFIDDSKNTKKRKREKYGVKDNFNNKRTVEKVFSVLKDIKYGREKMYELKVPNFIDIPKNAKTFSEIPKQTIDFIRVHILNILYSKNTNNISYVDRWNLGGFPLKDNAVFNPDTNTISVSTKGIHIPEIVKNQVDNCHEFYLVFSLMRIKENDFDEGIELLSGHFENSQISNVTICKKINYDMINLATTVSEPFLILNTKSAAQLNNQ